VPDGYVPDSTDCNDNHSGIHPGSCDDTNGVDDNCDGSIDDGNGITIYYADADGDTYEQEPHFYYVIILVLVTQPTILIAMTTMLIFILEYVMVPMVWMIIATVY
jgi:hypothetical protein